jgi:hypothetical protein
MVVDVNDGNLFEDGSLFKLQHAIKGSGTCEVPEFSYTDVTTTSNIAFHDNVAVADNSQVTSFVDDPTSPNTLTLQEYVELNNFSNGFGNILDTESGLYDFSLKDNAEVVDNTYCFKIVYAENNRELDTYTNYPEITTTGVAAANSLNFSISDNTLGFGTISIDETRYATADGLGASTDVADALVLTASTNAPNGYAISVAGSTLVCELCGFTEFAPIGGTALPSAVGTEQFGIRVIKNSGTGTVSAPYNSADWALDRDNFPDEIATGLSDNIESEFGVRAVGNASMTTTAGAYSGVLQFTITASF